jgi:hypothetical protein
MNALRLGRLGIAIALLACLASATCCVFKSDPSQLPDPTSDAGASTPAVTPTGPLTLTLRAWQTDRTTRTRRELRPGDTMRSRDLFAFDVRLDRPGHVYVLQFFAQAEPRLLFSTERGGPVSADRWVRIPLAPEWFEVDDVPGQEHIYVIASAEPLARADRRLYDVVRDVQVSPDQPDAPATPSASASASAPTPTPHAPAKTSGTAATPRRYESFLRSKGVRLVTVDVDGSMSFQGSAPTGGVGVFHFPFRHDP